MIALTPITEVHAARIAERDATIASQAAQINGLKNRLSVLDEFRVSSQNTLIAANEAHVGEMRAQIERLRHHLENMIEIAVEYMPENRPSIPHDYEPYDQNLADIAAARAELQPKEGEG